MFSALGMHQVWFQQHPVSSRMRTFILVALFAASVLSAPVDNAQFKRTLQDLVKALKGRTIFDKDDPAPIPIDRVEELLHGEFEDIAQSVVSDTDPDRLSNLIKAVMKVIFEDIPPENKGIVLGRFVEGYVEHVVYSEKNAMYGLAGEIVDENERESFRRIMNSVHFAMRNPSQFRRDETEEPEGSGPYVFSVMDAVNAYVLSPMDELVVDIYHEVYPGDEQYLGEMFYDIEGLLDQGFPEKRVADAMYELEFTVRKYLSEPIGTPAENLLTELGNMIMEYGRREQEIEAHDPPPVRGLSAEDEKVWAKVFKNFKSSNKYLSHAIRRIAKYTTKDKMENLANEISLYVVDLLIPESEELENLEDVLERRL